MDHCCRICRRNELKDYISLNYQSDFHRETGETVLEMLNSMTGLNVLFGDKLPQQLCRFCTGTLVAGYELRNLCIESDTFFRQTLQSDVRTQSAKEMQHNDLESCLTLEQVKLEPFLEAEEGGSDFEETEMENNDEESGSRFYCCFANCDIHYEFEELLTDHARSYHRLEMEANASESDGSEFRCIVCARAFADESKLLQHRRHKNTVLKLNCSDKNTVCACGFSTHKAFSMKRHQAKCTLKAPRFRLYANLCDNDSHPNKTNDEIIAMGFSFNRNTSMFYCCIPQCATVCETQQQLCDHFRLLHPSVREENMQENSSFNDVVRCKICFIGFPTEKALQIHREDTYSPTFRCNTCRYNCLTRRNAIMHANVSCGAKMHRCSCGYSTPYTYAIKRHMSSLGCPVEGSSLRKFRIRPSRTSGKIATDSKASKSEVWYECQNCEKTFSTIATLRRHTESELSRALAKQEAKDPGKKVGKSTKKQYTCCWCQAITEDSKHLVQCMVKAEKDTGENIGHKCSNCDEKFKKYNKYLEHKNSKVCLQKSWMSCRPCGVSFSSRKTMVKHMANIHHKIKPQRGSKTKLHECKDCQLRFVRAYTLNRHRKRLHNVEENCDATSESIGTLD